MKFKHGFSGSTKDQDIIEHIKYDASLIYYIINPTIEAQEAAFFAAIPFRNIMRCMRDRPKVWHMEEFFKENPHLLLAEEIGMLDD